VALKLSIDANIFLNVKNKEKPYYGYSRKILELIDQGKAEGVVSTLVIAELCAGYHEFNELAEKDEFLAQLAANPNYKIVNLDLKIADEAGRIRAATHLRLPDAILVASSLIADAKILVTHDDQLTKAQDVIRVLTAEQALRELQVIETEDGILFKPKKSTGDLAGSGAEHANPKEMKKLLDRLREEDV